MSLDVDQWWEELRTASLIGTTRRDVPAPPDLGVVVPDGPREDRLLSSAALADAVRRAGRRPVTAPTDVPEAATPETATPATGTAAQVLGLLLSQPPVGAEQRLTLLAHWLRCCAEAGRLVPAELLPRLLDDATRHPPLRAGAAATVGARGHWLAGHHPDWGWLETLAEPAGPDPDGWAHLPAPARLRLVSTLRPDDPGTARELVRSTWASEPAKDRAALLSLFAAGLGPDDEELLEACLDDRAKAVREEAVRLLDRLPSSARAGRMAGRLRPLLAVRGALRPVLEVELPAEPDAAGVRDGLVDPGPGRSRRAHWLRRIVAATPLTVWTTTSGRDPARTLAMLRGDGAEMAVLGLRDAARRQGDPDWARALLASELDTSLLAQLPREEQEGLVADRLRRDGIVESGPLLARTATPWGPGLSRLVVEQLRRERTGHAVRVLRDTLVAGLDPSALEAVEAWLRTLGPDDDRVVRTTLRDVLQFQSLHSSISEAFR